LNKLHLRRKKTPKRKIRLRKSIFRADHRDEVRLEYAKLTLCFSDKGAYLLEDVHSPGWAAGIAGGGTVRTELDEDFYVGDDAERDADDYVGAHHYEKVRGNQELAAFFAEANRRLNKR
jgi:hypothetical protein